MAKAKDPPEDDPDEEGSPDGDESPEDDGGDGPGGSDLESHIRAVVHDVIDTVLGKRAPAPASSGPRQDEAAILAMVKDAQGKLRAEEEKDARFEAVAGEVESLKKVVEKAPTRSGLAGKVQAFLWGSE